MTLLNWRPLQESMPKQAAWGRTWIWFPVELRKRSFLFLPSLKVGFGETAYEATEDYAGLLLPVPRRWSRRQLAHIQRGATRGARWTHNLEQAVTRHPCHVLHDKSKNDKRTLMFLDKCSDYRTSNFNEEFDIHARTQLPPLSLTKWRSRRPLPAC